MAENISDSAQRLDGGIEGREGGERERDFDTVQLLGGKNVGDMFVRFCQVWCCLHGAMLGMIHMHKKVHCGEVCLPHSMYTPACKKKWRELVGRLTRFVCTYHTSRKGRAPSANR